MFCRFVAHFKPALARSSSPSGLRLSTVIFSPCSVAHCIYQAGRLVLDKEKFRQRFQDDCELTEVDLESLEIPDEPDVCHARPYDSTVVRKIPTAVNSKSSLGTEEDITDERPRDFVDVS